MWLCGYAWGKDLHVWELKEQGLGDDNWNFQIQQVFQKFTTSEP